MKWRRMRWGYRFVFSCLLALGLILPFGCASFIAKKAYKVAKAGFTELMSDDSGGTAVASRDGSSDKER